MPVDNNIFQKNANISMVLNSIWRNKHISRVDIARELNLYRSTVTNIVSYLLENNLIKEGRFLNSSNVGGRRAVELTINPNFGCVIGFDIQPSHYRAIVLTADGSEIFRQTGSFGEMSLDKMIEEATILGNKINKKLGIPLMGISFSIPGIVDETSLMIDNSFPFGMLDIDVKKIVSKYCDCPIFLENDANAASWLDIYKYKVTGNAISIIADFHEEARTNPEVVGIGTGVGIIINGKVYKGSHHAAGEFKTISWKKGLRNQSGIAIEDLKKTLDDRKYLEKWLVDVLKSFVPIFSVMDFEKVFFHGIPFTDEKWIVETVKKAVPEFGEILKNTKCEYVFDSQDECVSAMGAASKALQKYFSIPDLKSDTEEIINWEKVFDFSSNMKK